MNKSIQYHQQNKEKFQNELIELLKIRSVSTLSSHDKHTISCANWIKNHFEKDLNLESKIIETEGHPSVYAEKIISKDLPTILFYGHYDVQPVDPIELWDTDPFEPTIKTNDLHPKGAIYGRGTADDKGQFFIHVKAIEALVENDELKCNIKFLIEGEEEIGSPNLEKVLKENKELLKCDLVLISDTDIFSKEQPTITTGLRGLCYMEVEVEGPKIDLHSGLYGGAVPNPINSLAEIISKLKDSETGKIQIPGFYDRVIPLTQEERKSYAKISFDLEKYKNDIGINGIVGEEGYSTLERASARPTLDVNGIWGGYIEEGAKTVIPSKAFAKISMRLVPDQDPLEIERLFTDYFNSISPEYLKIKVTPHHGGKPYLMDLNHPAYLSAKKAYQTTFGVEALPLRGGGSIPIVSLFEDILEAKSLLMGFGLNTDAIHSPNEHFGLDNFHKGIDTIINFLSKLEL